MHKTLVKYKIDEFIFATNWMKTVTKITYQLKLTKQTVIVNKSLFYNKWLSVTMTWLRRAAVWDHHR